jgi:hypothetical protein
MRSLVYRFNPHERMSKEKPDNKVTITHKYQPQIYGCGKCGLPPSTESMHDNSFKKCSVCGMIVKTDFHQCEEPRLPDDKIFNY